MKGELMDQVEFVRSEPFTLGVELEFQILDPNTLDLVSRAGNLVDQIPDPEKSKIAFEFLQSIFEVQTGICGSVDEVEQDLRHTVKVAEEAAYACGCFLFASGIHPFAWPGSQLVTDNERYSRIMEELQLVGRQFISQGLHVHVGMPDGDTAIRICDVIQGYLPLLLALSTSSPYFKGEDTGFQSYRTKLFEALPLAGITDHLGSWSAYKNKIMMLHSAGIINEIRDLWWEVRPSPYFGTLEIRVCDMPSGFQDILALTAFIQALAVFLYHGKPKQERIDPQLLRYNKWQAARHGLQGSFMDPFGLLSAEKLAISSAVLKLLEILEPVMQEMASAKWCSQIQHIMDHGTSSDRQRKLVAEVETFKDMISKLHKEFWI
jgi:carboxylate-amine ligase